MARPADFVSFGSSREKANFQERVWSLPGVKIDPDFRGSDYFRTKMRTKVEVIPGYDKLDEKSRTVLRDRAVRP